MKKSILVLMALLYVNSFFTQKTAVTENGEEVILNEDGTWEYKKKKKRLKTKKIKTNPTKFTKSSTSTFRVKSTVVEGLSFWINPTKWSFKKAKNNEDAEYELHLKKKDLYAMVITEKFEIPLESFPKIAVDNAKEVAPDIKVVSQEYRKVNGLKVLCLQLNGTMQGIKISYYNYYYSCPTGTVQFVTYTAQSMVETYRKEADELLNGLTKID